MTSPPEKKPTGCMMLLVRAMWYVATAGVAAACLPLAMFSFMNPVIGAGLAIVVLGYGALLWQCELGRHDRAGLPGAAFKKEMIIHGVIFGWWFLVTGIFLGAGIMSGIARSIV